MAVIDPITGNTFRPPEGWLDRQLRRQRQENVINIKFDPEKETITYVIKNGFHDETYERTSPMDKEKWLSLVKTLKLLGEEPEEFFEKDLFNVD